MLLCSFYTNRGFQWEPKQHCPNPSLREKLPCKKKIFFELPVEVTPVKRLQTCKPAYSIDSSLCGHSKRNYKVFKLNFESFGRARKKILDFKLA